MLHEVALDLLRPVRSSLVQKEEASWILGVDLFEVVVECVLVEIVILPE